MKIRVWRQLCRDSRAQSVTNMIAALESDLRQKLTLVHMHCLTHLTLPPSLLLRLHLLFCKDSIDFCPPPYMFNRPLHSPLSLFTFLIVHLTFALLPSLYSSYSQLSPTSSSLLSPLLHCSFLQLPCPVKTDAEAINVFSRSDSTVVLFYDHLTHSTPDEHVESIAR
jgi:hypothetical protein